MIGSKSVAVSVLLSAHIKRFSVSRMQNLPDPAGVPILRIYVGFIAEKKITVHTTWIVFIYNPSVNIAITSKLKYTTI